MSQPTAAAPAAAPAPEAGSPEALAAAAAAEAAAKAAAAPPPPPNFDEKPQPAADAPDDEAPEVVYNPTGDTSLDLALQFVGRLGFGPDREDMKAAQQGDFTKLEASLKALGDKAKGYDRYLAAAKESYKRVQDTKSAREAAIVKTIEDSVGGADNWKAIHAWVSKEASPEQKQEITAAFGAGPYAASAMARQLADLYRQSGVSNIPPKGAVSQNAEGAPAASGKGPLSPAEYKAEIRKLEARLGTGKVDSSAEYAELNARRRAYQPK